MQQGFSMPSGYNFGLTPVKFTRNEKKENTNNDTSNNNVSNNNGSWQMFNQYPSVFNPYQNSGLNLGILPNYNNGIVIDNNSGIPTNYSDWTGYNLAKGNGLIDNNMSFQEYLTSNPFSPNFQMMGTGWQKQLASMGNNSSNQKPSAKKTGSEIPSTETGGSFGDWLGDKTSWLGNDWMTKLENVQNIANIGLGGLSAYANWDSYKMNKNLAQKNIALLEQQIEQNRENMENTRQERARRDKMRSNAQSQRASTSSIRG